MTAPAPTQILPAPASGAPAVEGRDALVALLDALRDTHDHTTGVADVAALEHLTGASAGSGGRTQVRISVTGAAGGRGATGHTPASDRPASTATGLHPVRGSAS